MKPPPGSALGFFVTPPHKCGYLPGRSAVTIFVDPRRRPNVSTYTMLSQHGFRRSGDHVYRPQCPDCSACIPARPSAMKPPFWPACTPMIAKGRM